jgi:hypothetical protein
LNDARSVHYGLIFPRSVHYGLIFPGFVGQGGAVEFFAIVRPEGHEAVHIRCEAIIMMAFEEMN